MIDLDRVENILVRAPNWLGDLVMATPALRSLRSRCPNARIVVWVREGLEPVLAGSSDVDEIRTLPQSGAPWRDLSRSVRRVRQAGPYDLGLCLPDSFSSAILMRWAGGRPLVGYTNAARKLLLDQPVPIEAGGGEGRRAPREDRIQGLLATLGVASPDFTPRLVTTPAEEESVQTLLGWKGQREKWIGLAPGAAYGPSKCWPTDRYAALGDALANQGARIFVLGSPKERDLCSAVSRQMTLPCMNLAGQLDLGGVKALTRRLDLMICNDSGARHLAVGLEVPSLVFFGPTDVLRTRRNLQNVSVLEEKEVRCRPCYKRNCPIDHRCLLDLTVPQALREAENRLARGWSSPTGHLEEVE